MYNINNKYLLIIPRSFVIRSAWCKVQIRENYQIVFEERYKSSLSHTGYGRKENCVRQIMAVELFLNQSNMH